MRVYRFSLDVIDNKRRQRATTKLKKIKKKRLTYWKKMMGAKGKKEGKKKEKTKCAWCELFNFHFGMAKRIRRVVNYCVLRQTDCSPP